MNYRSFFLVCALVLGLLLIPTVEAANAAPLGQEIGVATMAQVQSTLGKQTRLRDAGGNKFSGGKMLVGDGEGLELEGLTEVVFIFDRAERLAGVVMTMEKSRFQEVLGGLSKKYTLVKKQVPFVGDSYARLKQGNSVVELEAPHMSFSMELRYLSNELLAAFNSRSANEAAEKKRAQESKL